MLIRFRRNFKGMFRFVLSILFILAVPIILSSVLSCRVGIQAEPYGPGPRPAHLSTLEGPWFFTTQFNWTGKLEFYWTGNTWSGRIWFDSISQWEELTNIFLDPRTGQLQFLRPNGNWVFSGTTSGKRIHGMWGVAGAATYSWEARRP